MFQFPMQLFMIYAAFGNKYRYQLFDINKLRRLQKNPFKSIVCLFDLQMIDKSCEKIVFEII